MLELHSLRLCPLCAGTFLLCRSCDRRFKYCSPPCSRSARTAAQRAATLREQQTELGRRSHADRNKAYRDQ